MDDEDGQLLAAYGRGEAEALGQLVAKYQRPLFAFLARFAARPGEADEWFQETWVRAIQHMNRFRQKNLLGWLFRIAHHLIIDQARRKKPEVSLDTPAAGEIPAAGPSPADETARHDLGQRIATAAARLPVAQREVFWLRMDAGLPFKEIARIQRCSINTSLARMQSALAKLRVTLAPEYRELLEP